METEIKSQLEYRIVKIHTVKFSFSDLEEVYADAIISGNHLNGELNVQINFDSEKSTVSFDISTHMIDTRKEEAVVQHLARTVYEVKGLNETYNAEKDAFNIPDDLIVQLYAISFSHARALLATELSPTVFKDKYFLPIIDPKDILKATS